VHIICFSVHEAWSAPHPSRRATFIIDFQDLHNSQVGVWHMSLILASNFPTPLHPRCTHNPIFMSH
jgi:hypothetical protein